MEVISGKEDRKPTSMALRSVDSAGLHMAACKKAMRWAIVAVGGQWRARQETGCAAHVDADEECGCVPG